MAAKPFANLKGGIEPSVDNYSEGNSNGQAGPAEMTMIEEHEASPTKTKSEHSVKNSSPRFGGTIFGVDRRALVQPSFKGRKAHEHHHGRHKHANTTSQHGLHSMKQRPAEGQDILGD